MDEEFIAGMLYKNPHNIYMAVSKDTYMALQDCFAPVDTFAYEPLLKLGYHSLILDWPRCKFIVVMGLEKKKKDK